MPKKKPEDTKNSKEEKPAEDSSGELLSPGIFELPAEPEGEKPPVTEGNSIASESVDNMSAEEADAHAAKILVGDLAGDPVEKPAEDETKAIHSIGERKFETQEALVAYAIELEAKVAGKVEKKEDRGFLEEFLKKEVSNTTDASTLNLDDSDALNELIQDPKAFEAKLVNKALAKFEEKTHAKNETTKTWKEFYTSNPELVGSNEIVDLVHADVLREIEKSKIDIPRDTGMKLIAERSREILKKARGSDFEVEEIESENRADSISSSGDPAPVRVTKTEAPKRFGEQIRDFQRTKGIHSPIL